MDFNSKRRWAQSAQKSSATSGHGERPRQRPQRTAKATATAYLARTKQGSGEELGNSGDREFALKEWRGLLQKTETEWVAKALLTMTDHKDKAYVRPYVGEFTFNRSSSGEWVISRVMFVDELNHTSIWNDQ